MGTEIFPYLAAEAGEIDAGRLEALRQSLGDVRCRQIVEEAVFHLAERLDALAAGGIGERSAARESAARLAGLGAQIGLTGFARVAGDLVACLDAGDPVASAAVAQRLQRLGEASLFDIVLHAGQSSL